MQFISSSQEAFRHGVHRCCFCFCRREYSTSCLPKSTRSGSVTCRSSASTSQSALPTERGMAGTTSGATCATRSPRTESSDPSTSRIRPALAFAPTSSIRSSGANASPDSSCWWQLGPCAEQVALLAGGIAMTTIPAPRLGKRPTISARTFTRRGTDTSMWIRSAGISSRSFSGTLTRRAKRKARLAWTCVSHRHIITL